MKSFKEYLAESKRTFAFRIRIADYDLDGEALDRIERGLDEFRICDITKPKSLPVAHTTQFRTLGPVGVEMFEVTTDYPAIPPQIQQAIHNCTGIPLTHIYVDNPGYNDEDISDWDKPAGGAILNDPELKQDDNNAQDHVGLKRVDSLLKELGKDRHNNEQIKGHNDELLAKAPATEKAAKTTNEIPQGTKSTIGSTKNKLQGPRGK